MKYQGNGFIKVRAALGSEKIPIKDALIIIRGVDEENMEIERSRITDADGITELVEVTTPSKMYSETPDPAEPPFANYSIEARKNGYKPVYINPIEVFDGETSFVEIAFLPV